ncbi:TetR/AcrR family transcriptional regulator [Crossiella sp. NPDC003009]
MPKIVDHEQRRALIIEGLVRLAARTGLHAVKLRDVAAEAEVSLRQVQYYFDSKAHLLLATLEYLERRSDDRLAARLAALPRPPALRAYLTAFLAEALPTDRQSRAFHQVFTSFAVLAMTEPEYAAQPFIAGPRRLERQLTEVLRAAQQQGELAEHLDPAHEATMLLTMTHGLGTNVLVGQRTPKDAHAVLAYHLDRLLGGSEGATAH